jgi:hypothetical protein
MTHTSDELARLERLGWLELAGASILIGDCRCNSSDRTDNAPNLIGARFRNQL